MTVNYIVLVAWLALLALAVLITVAVIPAVWSLAMFGLSLAITGMLPERPR